MTTDMENGNVEMKMKTNGDAFSLKSLGELGTGNNKVESKTMPDNSVDIAMKDVNDKDAVYCNDATHEEVSCSSNSCRAGTLDLSDMGPIILEGSESSANAEVYNRNKTNAECGTDRNNVGYEDDVTNSGRDGNEASTSHGESGENNTDCGIEKNSAIRKDLERESENKTSENIEKQFLKLENGEEFRSSSTFESELENIDERDINTKAENEKMEELSTRACSNTELGNARHDHDSTCTGDVNSTSTVCNNDSGSDVVDLSCHEGQKSDMPDGEGTSRECPHLEESPKASDTSLEPISSSESAPGEKNKRCANYPTSLDLKDLTWSVVVYSKWRKQVNENLTPKKLKANDPFVVAPPLDECITIEQVDFWMSRLITEARRKDGQPYPHGTLRQLIQGVFRYLRRHCGRKDIDLVHNKGLAGFRHTYQERLRQLMADQAESVTSIMTELQSSITQADEQQLWDMGVFSLNSARGLLGAIYFYTSKIFGLTTAKEHQSLRKSNFVFGSDEAGEFVSLHLPKRRYSSPQHYADPGNPRCYIHLLQTYLQHVDSGQLYFYHLPLDMKRAGAMKFSYRKANITHFESLLPKEFYKERKSPSTVVIKKEHVSPSEVKKPEVKVPEVKKPALPERFVPQSFYSAPCSPVRAPPDIQVSVQELNPLLTCTLCKGYIINAATITECLHTFCKSCLVRHVGNNLHCPSCGFLIHPSNPLVNIRLDGTMQDIVYKLLPHVEEEEKRREKEFYESRNIPYPLKAPKPEPEVKKRSRSKPSPSKPAHPCISLQLDYIGTTPGLGQYTPLVKRYLRVPTHCTVENLGKFLTAKLHIASHCQVCLFLDNYLLHRSLSMEAVTSMFHHQEELLPLQYGIVPADSELLNNMWTEEPMDTEEQ